ncbi:Tuftelin-interacting protein 11, partial [Cichlidogyrus casuarinus]
DRSSALEYEIERLEKEMKIEGAEIACLDSTLGLIREFEEFLEECKSGRQRLDSQKSVHWLKRLKCECVDLAELPALIASFAKPIIDLTLVDWQPLENPKAGVELFSMLKQAISNDEAFNAILETAWLPPVRRAIQSSWEPKTEFESLLQLLETWQSLLSKKMLRLHVLAMLVYPRLQESLEAWNPLRDPNPVHLWMHPWLPWFHVSICMSDPDDYVPPGFNTYMPMLHDVVRRKLAACLKDWHPSDSSAYTILLPWKGVFEPTDLTQFVHKNIVPKLIGVLQHFQVNLPPRSEEPVKVNPTNQNMEPWSWVTRWTNMATPSVIVNLLERYFLPKWTGVLCNWLNQGVQTQQTTGSGGAIFQEIAQWYSGWKAQFPLDIVDYPAIKSVFTNALSMMEHAMRGLPVTDPYSMQVQQTMSVPPPSTVPGGFYQQATAQAYQSYRMAANLNNLPPASVKEQVERVAHERGLLFCPSGKSYEGKQIYRLEQQLVLFDRNVPFTYDQMSDQWCPIPYQELMARVT